MVKVFFREIDFMTFFGGFFRENFCDIFREINFSSSSRNLSWKSLGMS